MEAKPPPPPLEDVDRGTMTTDTGSLFQHSKNPTATFGAYVKQAPKRPQKRLPGQPKFAAEEGNVKPAIAASPSIVASPVFVAM